MSFFRAALAGGVVGASIFSTGVARADFFLHHWTDQYEAPRSLRLAPTVGYYFTQQNFNSVGTILAIDGLTGYSRFQGDAEVAFGFLERLTLYGRLTWERVQVDHATLGGYSFGLGDQTVGGSVRLKEWQETGASIQIQVQADLPAYNNNTAKAANIPFLGDGSADFTGGAFATYPLIRGARVLALHGGVGFTWRTDNFSMAVPWSVSADYRPTGDGLWIALSAVGLTSLRTDPNANSVPGTHGSAGTGGSFVTNAVNPSLFGAKLQLGYQLAHNIGLAVSGEHSVWGQAAPNGWLVTLGLTARIGFTPVAQQRKNVPGEYDGPNKGFVNYTFEARVTRPSGEARKVRIDKGLQDGVEKGQVFDIFSTNQSGSISEAVARARVTEVRLTDSDLQITEYFREVWIEEGFFAKRPIQ